jgi:BirA family transcriptional regulator, biotin operon repressor / biotin---[acetyl-CoA-carboxylase] ligase
MTDTAASGQPALDQRALRDQVLAGSLLWSELTVVAETGSTNEDLIAAARQGAAAGTVLVAEAQTRGRGRLGRSWASEPGKALTFSVLVRPAAVPPAARGWLPLLAGVAVVSAVRQQTGLEVGLKWPNDVLAGPGKLAGILAEQSGEAIVVGFGINVESSQAAPPSASSLAQLGAPGTDRQRLLAAVLAEFERWYLRWTGADGAGGQRPGDAVSCGLRAEYLRSCATIGRQVSVELPGGKLLAGRAGDVDASGRLLVTAAAGVQPVSAGDVVHVR